MRCEVTTVNWGRMMMKAVFLDFYGTLVHEDDAVLPLIYRRIVEGACSAITHREIGDYWWKLFSRACEESYETCFKTQRSLAIKTLSETIHFFYSNCTAEEIIAAQFGIGDSRRFLTILRRSLNF